MRFSITTTTARLGLLLLAGCGGDVAAPAGSGPPYLAVVAKIDNGTIPGTGIQFQYRIKDLSADGQLDTLITAAPNDTLILSVRPATYEISLGNLPTKCKSRRGTSQTTIVPEGINTAITRFFISCDAPLAVTVFTLGGPDALRFVWELRGPPGQQTGLIDTKEQVVIFDPLLPGEYTFSVWNFPPSCEVTSRGRRVQKVVVPPTGGAELAFVVVCSDPPTRPVLADLHWSFHDGAAVFLADVTDPDGNLAGYYFDLTDCAGTSLLPDGERERGGLLNGRTARATTTTIIGAFELAIDPAQVRCASVRMVDASGNTTPFREWLPTNERGSPPAATRYNAALVDTTSFATVLVAADPDRDFFGTFVALRLRDGVLGLPDGQPDIGIYNTQGYEGTEVPPVPLGARILSSDIYGQIAYLIDRKGHFRRITDDDPFK